jgi:Fe-S cluster assembly protein SufB
MKAVPPTLHKFAALHGAVWSGGTFLYIPKGIHIALPLQAYFRMNAQKGGQFEHTLIIAEEESSFHYIEGCSAPQYTQNSLHAGCVEIFVGKGAKARYSSVENWSKNTYNLNTKRAFVEENGIMEWVGGNMGSGVTMLYPTTFLKGKGAKAEHLSIAYAGRGQNQDVGSKIYHLAPNTSSIVTSKSISKDGGMTSYRGLLHISKDAKNSKSSVQCDAMMIDKISKSDTIPYINVNNKESDIGHEATVGKISPEEIFYLMSRGLSEEQATQMIVSGFISPIVKQLPLEYAVELNKLIEMEMEGSLG